MHLAIHLKKLVQLCQLNSIIPMSNSSDIHTHIEMRPQDTTKALKDCITQGQSPPAACSYTAGAPRAPDVRQLCPGGTSAVRGTRRSSPQPVSALKHGTAVPLHPWMWLKYEQKSCSFFAWICGRFGFVLEKWGQTETVMSQPVLLGFTATRAGVGHFHLCGTSRRQVSHGNPFLLRSGQHKNSNSLSFYLLFSIKLRN